MARRRSIYKLPRFKLKHKTITAIGTLVAFGLAVLSGAALFTNSEPLSFWRDFLSGYLGFMKITAPLIFLLAGLVLTKARWRIAQTNVLLGFVLVVISIASLISAVKFEKGGLIGQTLWTELSSFVTPMGASALLILVFLIGLVVFFNTSLQQIFAIFGWLFNNLKKIYKIIFVRGNTFEARHIPIKVSGVEERLPIKPQIQPKKESIIADVLVQNVAGKGVVWKYPPLH